MAGIPGQRIGGRQKGTPNKKTVQLKERAQRLGFDPFEMLLRVAKGDWQGLELDGPISIELRVRAACEACKYLYPQRKAIEVSDERDPNLNRPYKNLSNEELEAGIRDGDDDET